MLSKIQQAILEACNKAMTDAALREQILKAGITTSTGLGIANVEQGVRNHIPIRETFFRDNIFRRTDAAGNSSAWKVLASYDTTKMLPYVPEGKRAPIASKSISDASAIFGMIGIEDSMTKMAAQQGAFLFGGEPTEQAWFRAALQELFALNEDNAIAGANKDYALPKPTTVAGVASSGGSVTGTAWAKIVPLTLDGFKLATLASGLVKEQAVATGAGETYTNPGGCGPVSDAMPAGVAASAQKITWTWNSSKGAAAYGVFVALGASAPPDSDYRLQAIATKNAFVQTTQATGTQTLAALGIGASDFSRVPTAWRGMIYQGLAEASFYHATLNGSGLTMTNGVLDQLAAAVDAFWTVHGIEPEFFALTNTQAKAIAALALGASNPRVQFTVGQSEQGGLIVGARVTGIVSHITGSVIPLKVMTNWPDGWILLGRWNLPNTPNASPRSVALRTFGGAWAVDWTPQTLTDFSGIYEHGGVEMYCPFAWGLIQDVG